MRPRTSSSIPTEFRYGQESKMQGGRKGNFGGHFASFDGVLLGLLVCLLSISPHHKAKPSSLNETFPVQISSAAFKPSAYMSAGVYEWYDRVDEEGNMKTLHLGWL